MTWLVKLVVDVYFLSAKLMNSGLQCQNMIF